MIRIAQFSDLHYSEKNLVEADRCFGFAVDEATKRVLTDRGCKHSATMGAA